MRTRDAWLAAPAALALLACGPPALAGEPSSSSDTSPPASTAAPAPAPARIERLAWLAGHWRGTEDGAAMEELWLAPAGGLMLGLHRDVGPGGRAFFEYLRIEEDAAGLVYLASPRGAPPVPFRAVEVGERRVAFENPDHDYPTRIVYELDGEGGLAARIEGLRDGRPESSGWRWTRAAAPR